MDWKTFKQLINKVLRNGLVLLLILLAQCETRDETERGKTPGEKLRNTFEDIKRFQQKVQEVPEKAHQFDSSVKSLSRRAVEMGKMIEEKASDTLK